MNAPLLNLLIVDDEEPILHSLRFLFRRKYRVTTATSGEQAWELIVGDGYQPQIVLSDQRMANMQGHELLKKIHDLDPYVASILITGYTDMESLIMAINEGHIYSYIAKPWKTEELELLVEKAAQFFHLRSENLQLTQELQTINTELEQRVEERTTELKKLNKLLVQSNQELEDFAYISSHDLKEPLRGIHNYAEFLLEEYADKLEESGVSYLKRMGYLARRMSDLIEGLLQYSRVGSLGLAIKKLDLNDVLNEVLDTLQPIIHAEKAEVHIEKPLPTMRCDRIRIGEIFQNLIANGIKYNDKQNKRIDIGFKEPDSGPHVFFVRDNGIGIDDKHWEQVFQIFKRLHLQDQYGGGTGAGLSIVKKIILRHGGDIWIESTLGEGTTFFFTLAETAEISF